MRSIREVIETGIQEAEELVKRNPNAVDLSPAGMPLNRANSVLHHLLATGIQPFHRSDIRAILGIARRCIDIHGAVVMDTPEGKAQHARAMEQMERAYAAALEVLGD